MGDRGCQLPHGRDAIGVRQRYLGLAQGFRSEHMLGEVAANREHGFHPFRVWPQRRMRHRKVALAKWKVEPRCVIDFLSREAPIVMRLGGPFKILRAGEVRYMLADKR